MLRVHNADPLQQIDHGFAHKDQLNVFEAAVFLPFRLRNVKHSVRKLKANVSSGVNLESYGCLLDINLPKFPHAEKLSVQTMLLLNGLCLLSRYGLQPVQYCACDPELLLFEEVNCKTLRVKWRKIKD